MIRQGLIPSYNFGQRLTRLSRQYMDEHFKTKDGSRKRKKDALSFEPKDCYTIGEIAKSSISMTAVSLSTYAVILFLHAKSVIMFCSPNLKLINYISRYEESITPYQSDRQAQKVELQRRVVSDYRVVPGLQARVLNGQAVWWNLLTGLYPHPFGISRPLHVSCRMEHSTISPKRDLNGIIQCRSTIDQEACIYADNVRKLRQHEYDSAVLYTDKENEIATQNERSEQDFIKYFNGIISKRHPNSSNSIIVNWTRVGELLKIYSQGNPIPFKTISVKLLEDIKMFLLRAPMGGNKKGTISQNTASTLFLYSQSRIETGVR